VAAARRLKFARLQAHCVRWRRVRIRLTPPYADRAGIHRTYVSDIERGRRNPTVTVVEKLAAPFDVRAGSLLD
jgi:transcriptional regulator with XRE-family HTH domain